MRLQIAGVLSCAVLSLAFVVILSSSTIQAGVKEKERIATQNTLKRPIWLPEEKWDSMERILDEQRAIITGELPNPALVKKAAETLWLTHHMSGLVMMPTPGPEVEKITGDALRMHVQQVEKSVGVIEGALNRRDINEDALALLLEVKVNLEAEVDWIQTIGKWTANVPPDSPDAETMANRHIRAPFLPLSFPRMREPQEDIRSAVIGQNDCMVVVKEIHGLKARLVAKKIPVWIEPWHARRKIVGYRVVWWVEYVPAEFIKRIVTCNKRRRGIERKTFVEIKEEPELLNFWQFYRKDP